MTETETETETETGTAVSLIIFGRLKRRRFGPPLRPCP